MDEFRRRGFIPWGLIVNWLLMFCLEGPARIDAAYRTKRVDPGGGAQAAIFEPEVDLYRVYVKRVMPWEYTTVGTRGLTGTFPGHE